MFIFRLYDIISLKREVWEVDGKQLKRCSLAQPMLGDFPLARRIFYFLFFD